MRPSDYFFSLSQTTRERVVFKWSSKGTLLAVAGEGRKVSIYNRSGRMLTNFVLPPPENKQDYGVSVVDMAWDSTGTKLAIVPRSLPCIILWSTSFMDSTQVVSTDIRDLTFVSWDPQGNSLAAGSSKGHLIIYNEHEKRKVVYVPHTRAITHGCWGPGGAIGLAGEDSTISVVNPVDGSIISQIITPKKPTDIQFATKKSEGQFGLVQPIMSAIVGNMLYVIDISNPSAVPLAFKFSSAYGTVKSYSWLSATFVVVAFETGQLVGYSTTRSDQEIYSVNAPSRITALGFSTKTNQLAIVCGRMLRIYQITQSECREIREQSMDFDLSQSLDSVGWTADGQLLTVSTVMGDCLAYLVSLPVVHGSCGTRVAYLSQLTQVSVVDSHELSGSLETGEGKAVPIICDVEPEPENLALGPEHLAVSLNNKVWYYRIGDQPGVPAALTGVRDFVGSVSLMAINTQYAAVLSNGRVIVHPLEANNMTDAQAADVVLPLTIQQGTSITCVSATDNFIIYGSSEGHLTHFTPQGKIVANEYRHARGIERLFPNPSGSRVIFQDSNLQVFLFSPVADTLLPVPAVDTIIQGCYWDQSDPSLFVLCDQTHIKTYIFNPNAVTQPPLTQLATNPVPDTHVPLVLLDGKLVCQLKASPHLESLLLRTHHALGMRPSRELSAQELEQRFKQAISLRRFAVAADAAATAGVRSMWEALFQASLDGLEVAIAIRCARALGDAGMVMTLEGIRHVEDRNLLAGHVSLLLHGDSDTSQDLFLRSSEPGAALRMRCDLRQWEEAMTLAQELDPSQVGRISKELGQMLEMRNEYDAALQRYEVCMDSELKKLHDAQDTALLSACQAGMCRCLVKVGQVRRAMKIAIDSAVPSICGECAVTLESQHHLAEAADMFLRAGRAEKAAEIYLAIKNYDAAGPLMAGIQSAKLQAMYARAKEAEGKWEDAIRAYDVAGESLQVIRILLERVKDPPRAFTVARRTRSVEGALKCAQFCINQGTDQFWPLAIEFLCLGGALEEALKEAINHSQIDTWEKFASDRCHPDLLVKAARHWETDSKPARAANCYFKAQMYPQALRLYLRSGPEGVEKATEVVEESKSRELGAEVLDFIMKSGADDPRHFKQMYKIQMALGRYDDAAATTIQISSADQREGNYRVAHQHLLEMTQLLRQQGRKVPLQLTQAFQILHSYILVKTRVKLDDHMGAARLLARVARSVISRFPKHIVPILTSTIIECQRANMNKTALDQAAVLMHADYRNLINPNYKRKIEAMVRKPDRDARDPDENQCPCPSCKQPGPEYDLECANCKVRVPMCIASGRRMTMEGKDWSACPTCLLPCRASEMRRVLVDGGVCPCCASAIDPDRIVPISDRDTIEALEQLVKN